MPMFGATNPLNLTESGRCGFQCSKHLDPDPCGVRAVPEADNTATPEMFPDGLLRILKIASLPQFCLTESGGWLDGASRR